MDTEPDAPIPRKRVLLMDYLVPVGMLAVWIVLQAWVLPKFGIQT